MSFFYGPVLSRRFGYSLGVDIIPFKVCVYDCIYCQLGKTTQKTIERKGYINFNIRDFKNELKKRIEDSLEIDYITFSGSGEPTLNKDIRRLIFAIKEETEIPVVVLTSGGLLGSRGTIDDIKEADLIKVSLDAPNNKLLKKINRPHREISFGRNILGLKELLDSYGGKVWLEIMLISGINDSGEALTQFKDLLESLDGGIEKIHINTPVRPAGTGNLEIPPAEKLNEAKKIFGERAEIIGKVKKGKTSLKLKEIEDDIYQIIKRRPATIMDISDSLGINPNQSIKAVNKLIGENKVKSIVKENKRYYFKE
ncbi:MAG: radical SAM protein [Actinomycetota bacterium]